MYVCEYVCVRVCVCGCVWVYLCVCVHVCGCVGDASCVVRVPFCFACLASLRWGVWVEGLRGVGSGAWVMGYWLLIIGYVLGFRDSGAELRAYWYGIMVGVSQVSELTVLGVGVEVFHFATSLSRNLARLNQPSTLHRPPYSPHPTAHTSRRGFKRCLRCGDRVLRIRVNGVETSRRQPPGRWRALPNPQLYTPSIALASRLRGRL